MAHEIESRDGRSSFFSVKESAWHKQGTVLTEAPTLDRAMEIARLDYEVVKVPVRYERKDDAGVPSMVASDMAFLTLRTDTQQELGAVGPGYVPVQNRDAFGVLEPLLDQGVAQLETGGVLRDGADAWLLVRWDLEKFGPRTRDVFADEVLPFSLIATNHSGRRGILLKDSNIRVVCANTLGFAERADGRNITVRHTGDAKERMVEAAQGMWADVIERYETLSEQYANLKARVLSEQEFEAHILDLITPDPTSHPKWNPEARMAAAVIDRAEKKRTELRRLWDEGDGHSGDHSAWEGYNAVAQAVDHNQDLFPVRGGVYRTASLLDGKLRDIKRDTLRELVTVSANN